MIGERDQQTQWISAVRRIYQERSKAKLEAKRLRDLALAKELENAENHRRLEVAVPVIAEVIAVVGDEVDKDGYYEGIQDDNGEDEDFFSVQEAVPVIEENNSEYKYRKKYLYWYKNQSVVDYQRNHHLRYLRRVQVRYLLKYLKIESISTKPATRRLPTKSPPKVPAKRPPKVPTKLPTKGKSNTENYDGDTTDMEDTHTHLMANIATKIVRAPKRHKTLTTGKRSIGKNSTKKVEGSKNFVQTKYNFWSDKK
jgi:hypothetical protein